MSRPCPKCGGAVYIQKEDQNAAIMIAVVSVVGMILVAIIFSAAGVGK